MAELIPLFPLGHVLFPGTPLPLRVFEMRYRQMLLDLADSTGPAAFGVVALRRGFEAGTDHDSEAIEEVGTMAEILDADQHDSGVSTLLTVGSRRFRVRRAVTEGAPYLRAEVEWLDEDDGELADGLVETTRRLYAAYTRALETLTERTVEEDLPPEVNLLSYHLAGNLPLRVDDRQRLLEVPTAAERLLLLARILHRETALLRQTRSVWISPGVLRMETNPN